MTGHDPACRALENREALDLVSDRWHELHGGRPSADDADPATREVEVIGPVGGVDESPGEIVQAGQVWPHGHVQAPDTQDEGSRGP